ncbi:MAG TPA: YceI family protein [Gaiellaceae bacterium]|nr:YceI family protein [Gaiellaceae bacterium]
MSTLESTSTTLAPAGTVWAADPVHSTVSFEVDYAGVSTFRGSFRDFDATLEGSALRGAARVASVDVKDEQLAAHLQSPDFFDAERYPEITFHADGLVLAEDGSVSGSGELTIKGTTRPVELHGRLAAAPTVDPFGRERLGLRLETTIDRNDFGVAWNAPNQSGGNYLGDQVALAADLTFVKQAG